MFDRKILIIGLILTALFYSGVVAYSKFFVPAPSSDIEAAPSEITIAIGNAPHQTGKPIDHHNDQSHIQKTPSPSDVTTIKTIITDFGLSQTLSAQALEKYGDDLNTTAFVVNPYAVANEIIETALKNGAHIWLYIPVQSMARDNDVGALGLSPYFTPEKNIIHFEKLLTLHPYVHGIVMNVTSAQEKRLTPTLESVARILARKNLSYFDMNDDAPAIMQTRAQEGYTYLRADPSRYILTSVYTL